MTIRIYQYLKQKECEYMIHGQRKKEKSPVICDNVCQNRNINTKKLVKLVKKRIRVMMPYRKIMRQKIPN